jgi:hypothetical protein
MEVRLKPGKKYVNLPVDIKLWNRFRSKCLLEGITLTEKLEELLRKEVGE